VADRARLAGADPGGDSEVAMVGPFVSENDAERERMRALVSRLSDAELARPMPAGWTVAAVLAHIAFWDARAIVYLDAWVSGEAPSPSDYVPEKVNLTNDAAKPLCLALAPREAALLALRLAEEADAKVAALSDEALAKIRAAGNLAPRELQDENGAPFNLSRAVHRREHLDDIERVLGLSRG
jgi:hypothetical protein